MRSIKALSLILSIFLLMTGTVACAAEEIQPYASALIVSYAIGNNAYVGGKVSVTTDISSYRSLDQIGFSSIKIQEYSAGKWVTVNSVSNKYAYNSMIHNYTLSYNGSSGRQYRGVVNYYAKDGDLSDSKSMTGSTFTSK